MEAIQEEARIQPREDQVEDKIPGGNTEGLVVLQPVKFLRLLIRHRRLLMAFIIAGACLGVAVALLWTPWYEGRAVFLPPQKTDMVTSASAAALMMQQDPSDTYMGMLASRSVADDVIAQMNLMKVYGAKRQMDARARLESSSRFSLDKNSLISVTVKAKEPVLAAGIANAYLSALYRLNGEMVASASAHRASFFEAQLEQQKDALSKAEVDLKDIQEKTGIVLPLGEAEAGLSTVLQLQSSIGTAEANLAALRQSETEDNADVIRAQARLNSLRKQLAHQQVSSKSQGPRVGITSMGNLPGVGLEYVRKERELKLREAVYDALTQQYEKARLASSDPGPQLQIVDRAVVPERKAGPPRTLMTIGGGVLGLLLAIFYLATKDWFHRLRVALAE